MNQKEGKAPQELAVERLRELYEGMKSQVEAYDKYLLMLSSGFLALGSGALTGDFLERASGLGWLAFSTAAFLLTIISLIMAYMYIQSADRKSINIIFGTEKQNQTARDKVRQIILETRSSPSHKIVYRWNMLNGSLFIVGVSGIGGFLVANI